jgi:hypothetical protein
MIPSVGLFWQAWESVVQQPAVTGSGDILYSYRQDDQVGDAG